MATKQKTQKTETVAPIKKGAVTVEVCEALKTSLLGEAQKLADTTFGKGKVAFAAGSAYSNHASGTAPGYGDFTLTFQFPAEFEAKLAEMFSALAKPAGLGLAADVKRVNRATFEFATSTGGKIANRSEINWNEWAGHEADGEDDYDFSMLETEWLHKSFLFDDGGGDGLCWYTVAGLNHQANKPVICWCDDLRFTEFNDDQTFFRFTAEQLAEEMAKQSKLKQSEEVKKSKPAARTAPKANGNGKHTNGNGKPEVSKPEAPKAPAKKAAKKAA